MPKNKTMTETMRENPWILSTLVLGIIVLGLIVNSFIGTEVVTPDLISPESLCAKATGTPAWFDGDGNLITTGYKEMKIKGMNNSDGIVKELIRDNIIFVYSSQCGWCEKQIEWFGESQWDEYKLSGLTVDCYGGQE